MHFQFTIDIDVERVQGKFASRDDIEQIIQEALENVDIDLDGIGIDGDSLYEVINCEIAPQPK